MINIQYFGSNFRASDIFGSDEIITNVPVTDADSFTVIIPVNRTLIGESSKSGTVILLSPMKNPFAEEIPVSEILFQDDLLNRFCGGNSLNGKTTPFRTMLGIPTIAESCLRPPITYDNSIDETIKHEPLIFMMIDL